jgi:hypothetical protein
VVSFFCENILKIKIKGKSRANQGQINSSRLMIVPTLRVGMPLWTLRVRLGEVTRSVEACMPTRSVGTIGMVLEDECNSTVGAGLLAKAFIQPTSSCLPRRVRQFKPAPTETAFRQPHLKSVGGTINSNSIREQARSHREGVWAAECGRLGWPLPG